jgi:hypothetical protein
VQGALEEVLARKEIAVPNGTFDKEFRVELEEKLA